MDETADKDDQSPELNADEVMEVLQKALATAMAAVQGGDLDSAETVFQGILEIDPKNPEALNGLGVVASAKGDLNNAERFLRMAVEADGENAQFHRNLGFVYLNRNRLKRAQSALGEAVRLNPDDLEGRYRLAWVLHGRGDMVGFEAQMRAVLAADGEHAQASNDLGVHLAQRGRLDEASEFLRQAAANKPDDPAFIANLGNVQLLAGDVTAARDTFAFGLENASVSAETLKGLATAERLLGNLDAAKAAAGNLLAAAPEDPAAENLAGTIEKELGAFDAAMAHFEKACQLKDGYAPGRSNMGMMKLLRGDWLGGFEDYEARRFDPNVVQPRGRQGLAQWDGSSLAKRSLLVQSEQGFGDTIQFCRFLPHLAEDADRVVFEVQDALRPLIEPFAQASGIELIAPGGDAGTIDVTTPLMSLPYFLKIQGPGDISSAPYLAAPTEAVELPKVLAEATGLKVGLNWRGSSMHKEDWKRSVAPEMLAALSELEGVQLFSLALGDDAATPDGIIDIRDAIGDFSDAATIMAGLDLVISVDTATVHLAGALGRPCWALIPFVPDWRWMLERADTPWYDSVRLYRQPARTDWDAVMTHIRGDLAALAAERG